MDAILEGYVLHDWQCSKCDAIAEDVLTSTSGGQKLKRCNACNTPRAMEILYRSSRARNAAQLDTHDMTVVYEHAGTGKIIYPGRNDVPMPGRYQQQGFVRKEMRSVHEINKFSAAHNLVNERGNYNSGNSYDSEPGRR